MADIDRMQVEIPNLSNQQSYKARYEIVLTGTSKSNWVGVPADKKGLFTEIYFEFPSGPGSGRFVYTPEKIIDIKAAADPDTIKRNIWPFGTVSEADIAVPNDYKSDSKATSFNAFRIECISGTIKVTVITN